MQSVNFVLATTPKNDFETVAPKVQGICEAAARAGFEGNVTTRVFELCRGAFSDEEMEANFRAGEPTFWKFLKWRAKYPL